MSNAVKFLIVIVVSYFVGNFTFARFLARTRNNDDITTHGSGNPGTMNMLRTHGVWLAVLTLVFDTVKSVLCCVGAFYLLGGPGGGYISNIAIYTAGVACVLGHNYPVIFKFKGGKGVACSLGLVFVAHPIIGPIVFASFLVIFLLTKTASLSSILCAVAYVIIDCIMLLQKGYYVSFILLIALLGLIVFAHRGNIKRIFSNSESKIEIKDAIQKDKDYAEEQKKKRLNLLAFRREAKRKKMEQKQAEQRKQDAVNGNTNSDDVKAEKKDNVLEKSKEDKEKDNK